MMKYQDAIDLALSLARSEDTNVTSQDIQSWDEDTLYDWLAAWDYEWIAGAWEYVGDEVNEI